ncbi:MAG: methylamine utilization protein MauG [Proteobacteria bacterium]|nr:methylamine utilization protein MauG [Pseudomonadota bacterium]TDJ35870.1 MAG: methylamine utilization protein MauG [Gammaproteobacteria bacterium]
MSSVGHTESLITQFSTAALFLGLLITPGSVISAPHADEITGLGRALFFDSNLSMDRNQSCASCHDPGQAFSDSRDSDVSAAVSLGDDGVSLGDRNTPATTYAFLIPDFHKNEKGEYIGGYFLDGRAATMVDQAAAPFVNPLEMAMPDGAAVVDRVRENPSYVESFRKNYGESIFSDSDKAFRALTESIVAFEHTALFAPFDSKYDRYLRGEYELTDEEELGRVLFFSQLINCSSCHLLDTREFSPGEIFSNHRYHNIGVPTNKGVRARNGVDVSHRDLGLLENPEVDDPAMAGKFRVPSLRNVAVTGPYMHNGVFQDLATAIRFYNRFTLSNRKSQTNPETGELWGEPEVAETVDLELLREGQPLADNHIVALVAFLTALTDQRHESLLDESPSL